MATNRDNSETAVILGGHVTGLGIVRALAPYPVAIEVWDSSPRCICCASNLVSKFRNIPIHTNKTLIAQLQQSRLDSCATIHVIPTDDLTTAIISNNRQRLLDLGINCWTDSWDKVKVFYDKRETYSLAKTVGVPHPFTIPAESLAKIESSIEYPVVIKPNAMEAFNQIHNCKGKVCYSKAELRDALDTYSPRDNSYALLAQEFIPGHRDSQFSLALCRGTDGSLRGLGVRRKRQYPIGVGTATYVETTDPTNMIDTSRRLLEEIDYCGICEVEFKLDARDGQLKLLEVNPRFFKWVALLAAAEVDFVQPFLEPTPFRHPVEIPWTGHSIGWQDIFADIAAILSAPSQLSGIGELLSDLRKKRSDAVIGVGDWGPMLQYIRILHRLARGGRTALQDR